MQGSYDDPPEVNSYYGVAVGHSEADDDRSPAFEGAICDITYNDKTYLPCRDDTGRSIIYVLIGI